MNRRWRWVAGLGVAALVFLTALDLYQHYRIPMSAIAGLALARGLGLALAWSRPRTAIVVSLLVTAITAAITVPDPPSEPWPWATTAAFGTSFILAIAGARGLGRRELVAWWIATQVVGAVALAFAPDRGSWSSLLVMAGLSAVAVVVADLLRSRTETRRRLAEQEVISKEERAERARLQERARIARELHDVVAHHLSVVVVRADSAPHRLPALQDDARQEFVEIADAARASLTEMRRVLQLLRDDEPTRELGPQPGLEQLPELVATTRRAGADAHLDDGVPSGLDPAVELAAYRIVQEALSNAVRHAPRSAVQVTVRREDHALKLIVRNGPGRAAGQPGGGQGLVGMRERVALVDGSVSTGPTPEGGYLVEASIPVEEVASGDPGAGG